MKPKVLLVVVLVLIVLMLVALGLGAGRGAAGSGAGDFDLKNASWAMTLRNRLTRSLPHDQIVNVRPGSCRPGEARFVLAPGQSCQATITGADDATRQLRLRLLQGKSVRAILEQPKALTVDLIIEYQPDRDAQPATLDIFKDADLRDASLLLIDCIVEIAEEDEEAADATPTAKTPANCVLALE